MDDQRGSGELMGCGCAKRAAKLLDAADARSIKVPRPVRSFLEHKASTATRAEVVKRAERLRRVT
jgi:hypothetical protein